MIKYLTLIPLLLITGICFAQETPVALVGGTVIDVGDWGRSIGDIERATIVFVDGRITAIGPTGQIALPPETKVIDISGTYVVPGLIDAFAALNNQVHADAFLSYGVTSIVGVDGFRRGDLFTEANPGPRIYRLDSIGTDPVTSPDLLRAIDEMHSRNVDVLLLMYSLRPDQIRAAVGRAHDLGIGTIGELAATSYRDGLEAGIDAFVHTTRYSLDTAPAEMARAIINEPFSDELESAKWRYYRYLASLPADDARLIAHAEVLGSGAVLIPTMSLLYLDTPGHRNPWDEPALQRLDPGDIDNPADRSTGDHDYAPEHLAAYRDVALAVRRLETVYRAHGARHIAGSGTDVWGTMPGFSLHTELEALRAIGLSNREVIAAATSNTAKTLRLEQIGELRPGYQADILVLDGDPLADLRALRTVRHLYLNGEEIPRVSAQSWENGELLEKRPFRYSAEFLALVAEVRHSEVVFGGDRAYANDVEMSEIFYASDGLRVHGYLAEPKQPGRYPCIIYNRGGNREFGALNERVMLNMLARIASWGYLVVASNYRGNGGGEGLEQFGGDDVNDILNLLPLLDRHDKADAGRLGMYGWSRGGMMTFLALCRTDRIKAAVVGGSPGDLFKMMASRPEMEEVFRELIPGYADDREAQLTRRSATRWPEKICKSTPILLLHGTADWRVDPSSALDLAQVFITHRQPFRLILFEGGDHGLTEHGDEVFDQSRQWLDRYVRDGAPLPNLEPHGR